MLIDSHCHLNSLASTQELAASFLTRAKEHGIIGILNPGVTLEEMPAILALTQTFSNIWAAVAVHPSEEVKPPSLTELLAWSNQPKVLAIGETGLDFSEKNDAVERKRQIELFELHLLVAEQLNKPIIIHSRQAASEILSILKRHPSLSGIIHCFTDELWVAEEYLALGFNISFSGIITFKKSNSLREILKTVPLEKLLLETDAPYLAPVPVRGKVNEPAYLRYTAECVAKVLDITVADLAQRTTQNFYQLMKIS